VDDIPALNAKSAKVIDRLFELCSALNGFGISAIAELTELGDQAAEEGGK